MPAAYLKAPSNYSPAIFCSKSSFPSRPMARQALGRMRKHHELTAHPLGGTVAVFYCGVCNAYHLGARRAN